MIHPPSSSTTAAVPCGNCWRCGGQLYENLAHICSTAVRVYLPIRPGAEEPGQPPKETEPSEPS